MTSPPAKLPATKRPPAGARAVTKPAPASGGGASVQRASLEIEGQGKIPVLFNPAQYAISKSNSYHVTPVPGTSLARAQFAGGQPRELTLELLLDVTLLRPKQASVRPITDKLFKMMEVVPAKGSASKAAYAPPTVSFRWGAVDTFKAVPTRLDVQYVLFAENGEPLRAWVRLSLLQVAPADSRSSSSTPKAQNPTSRANTLRTVHVFALGDSLPSISYARYGDATKWRVIADANGIDDPLALRPGRRLTVPALDA